MSNHLAIAHVTAAIEQLVIASEAQKDMGEKDITFGRPTAPDKGVRINIYLYHVSPHASLRNADLPFRRGDMLVRRPQAALVLHYLISFYGKDSDMEPARMMAAVVRDLHAHAVLKADFIKDAVNGKDFLKRSDLAESPDRIILTPQSLSLEDMSRLWSVMVQSPYALSVAYEAAVVLLDARETAPAPLPALRRGDDDRGPDAQAEPFPGIDSVWIGFPGEEAVQPRPQSLRAAELGVRLVLEGRGLAGDMLRLEFQRGEESRTLAIPPGGPVAVTLPDDGPAQTQWQAGIWNVRAAVTREGRDQRSPVWPLALAPRVTAIAPQPLGAGLAATLTLTCRPQVGKGQSVQLLVGDRAIEAEPLAAASSTVSFKFVPDKSLDGKLLILRVDGVDSQPILFDPAKAAFVFDDNQRLRVT